MKTLTRRKFMKSSLAFGTAAAIGPYSRVLGANDDVRVAVVGFHSQGSNHIKWFGKIPGVRVVELCDYDHNPLTMQLTLEKENIKNIGRKKHY